MSLGIHRLWKKYYADLLISKYKTSEKILDIASGTGDIFQLLPFKKNLYAIDPIEQMHRVSQEKNADKNIQYQVGYVEKLPYKNNFFQIISCTYGVRNYENRLQGFQEIFRCLKKKGYFLFMEFGLPKANLIKNLFKLILIIFYLLVAALLPKIVIVINISQRASKPFLPQLKFKMNWKI